MLKLPIIEFFLRGIPEGFLLIFAGYAFPKFKVNSKNFILSGILAGVMGYLIRFLPINFGIHTVLIIVVCIILLVNINKIPLIKAISASLIVMIIMFASEALNGYLIQSILEKDLDAIFADPIQKIFYGLPSFALAWLILIIVYFIHYKRGKLVDVPNRKDIE